MVQGLRRGGDKAAFARAAELAAMSDDFSERFAAAHGQWALAAMRGELRSVRELVSALPAQAEELRPSSPRWASPAGSLVSCATSPVILMKRETISKGRIDAANLEGEQEARERFGE